MVVRREHLCKCISNLNTSVETDFFVNGPIESHQESWVMVIVLGNRGVIDNVETCFYGFERMSSRIKPAFSVPQPESLRQADLAALPLALMSFDPFDQMIENLRPQLVLFLKFFFGFGIIW